VTVRFSRASLIRRVKTLIGERGCASNGAEPSVQTAVLTRVVDQRSAARASRSLAGLRLTCLAQPG
jgi:hypothetical protein